VLGERLVRVPGNALDVQLLELPIADPPMAEGTPLTGAFPPERLTGWDPQVFQRGQHISLTGGLGGARPELGIVGFDVSDPSRVLPTGSVTLPGPDAEAVQVIQTGGSLIVARNKFATLATPDEPASDASLSYDIIDVSTPGAPRVATRFDVPPALASMGFAYWPDSTSIDTAWGWQHTSQGAPLVVDGDLLVTQHVQIIDASRRRFFLDRQLAAAVDSHAADVPVTIERVRIDDGQLTRLPSLDVTGLHPTLPRYWRTLLARDSRVIAATAHDVAVIDFGVDPPSVRTAALPAWGCHGIDIDVAGEQIYCARGEAGLDVISVAP
jgi:hypothetical protein